MHITAGTPPISPSVFTQCWEDITYESICQQEVHVAVQGNYRSWLSDERGYGRRSTCHYAGTHVCLSVCVCLFVTYASILAVGVHDVPSSCKVIESHVQPIDRMSELILNTARGVVKLKKNQCLLVKETLTSLPLWARLTLCTHNVTLRHNRDKIADVWLTARLLRDFSSVPRAYVGSGLCWWLGVYDITLASLPEAVRKSISKCSQEEHQ